MSDFSTSSNCWSWRSCFATVKHNKTKVKKQKHFESYQSHEKLSLHDHITNKLLNSIDENSNFLYDNSSSTTHTKSNEEKHHVTSNTNHIKNVALSNGSENNSNEDHNIRETFDDMHLRIVNQKSIPTIRTTHLDVIVEDSNEDNSDEYEEATQPHRLYCDSELIDDVNDLYFRLFDFTKTSRMRINFNENHYLIQEFKRQVDKLKLKIDDTKRASVELPSYAELLEARYSTLLATIESLSLLLKVGQISSYYSLIDHLTYSVEQRIEQLNKYLKLSSSSINLRQQRQDLNDDDFLSFRSALSSYEHLLTMSS